MFRSVVEPMQQRYYDPQIGRFLSVDPVSTDPNSGAGFNRYSYATNNPYRFKDMDGRWPTSIHQKSIDSAFPGLSEDQRSQLKSASSAMDDVRKGGQAVENSYQHSMKSPSQTAGDAKQAAKAFIGQQEAKAKAAQGGNARHR